MKSFRSSLPCRLSAAFVCKTGRQIEAKRRIMIGNDLKEVRGKGQVLVSVRMYLGGTNSARTRN